MGRLQWLVKASLIGMRQLREAARRFLGMRKRRRC